MSLVREIPKVFWIRVRAIAPEKPNICLQIHLDRKDSLQLSVRDEKEEK